MNVIVRPDSSLTTVGELVDWVACNVDRDSLLGKCDVSLYLRQEVGIPNILNELHVTTESRDSSGDEILSSDIDMNQELQEFYLSEEYDPKATRHADVVKAAMSFVYKRHCTTLPIPEKVEG